MQNPPPVQTVAKSSTGLDENIAALLSYIFGWVGGLVFFLIEKESRLVRFHAMQSILLSASAIIGFIAIWILWVVFAIIGAMAADALSLIVSIIGGLLMFAFWIGIMVAIVMCLIKAYQRQYFKLPVLGNFAEKFSAK
jgi:uncharacterized membrane protein